MQPVRGIEFGVVKTVKGARDGEGAVMEGEKSSSEQEQEDDAKLAARSPVRYAVGCATEC